MLLVFHNGQHIENTGTTAALKNAMMAEGWWRATRQGVIAADIPEEELTFVWVEDDSQDAQTVIQTGGRVTLEEGGVLVHGEVPVKLPNVSDMLADLGRLLNIKAAQVEMGEGTATTQSQIDALKAKIQAAQ